MADDTEIGGRGTDDAGYLEALGRELAGAEARGVAEEIENVKREISRMRRKIAHETKAAPEPELEAAAEAAPETAVPAKPRRSRAAKA